MKKRVSALFLSLVMLISLLPTTALAAVGDLTGNSAEENLSILSALQKMDDDSYNDAYGLLSSLGLLNEDGSIKTDEKIVLDGQELTLAETEALLEDDATDLSRIASVDGTPISLGDLKTIIQIERELQRLQETYFSGRTFTAEGAANMNDLLAQLQGEGISLMSTSSTAPAGLWNVDMSAAPTNYTYNTSYQNYWYFPQAQLQGGKTVSVRYHLNKAALASYITDFKVHICTGMYSVNPSVLASGVLQSDGSYLLQYTSTEPSDYNSPYYLAFEIVLNTGAAPAYTYGDLLSAVSFYDASGMSFFNGTVYSDSYNYFYTKNISVPSLATSITAGQYDYIVSGAANDIGYRYCMSTSSSEGGNIPSNEFVALNNLIHYLKNAKGITSETDAIKYTVSMKIAQKNDSNTSTASTASFFTPYDSFSTNLIGLSKSFSPTTMASGTFYDFSFSASCLNPAAGFGNMIAIYIPYSMLMENVFSSNVSNLTGITKDVTVSLVNDGDNPTVAFTAPAGAYQSGETVPITMTFNELVKVNSGATMIINGNTYTAAQLKLNAAGKTLTAWYPVQDADGASLVVSGISGITDVFGNAPANVNWTAAGVTLKSVLMRNAPTSFSASYTDGKAMLTLTASQASAYRTKYGNFDSSTTDRLAPFQVVLYNNGTEMATLPVYLQEDPVNPANFVFKISDYAIAPTASAQSITAKLQCSEGSKAAPAWQSIDLITSSFTIPALIKVTGVTVSADIPGTAFTLADTTLPKLTAAVLPANATYKTGAWSSSNSQIATIGSDGQITLTGSAVGNVTFTFTADNGTTDVTSDDKTGTSSTYTVSAGDSPALVIPANASDIRVQQGQSAAILWSSNASFFASGKDFVYTVELFEGNFTLEQLSGKTASYSATAAKDMNSLTIPAEKITSLSAYSAGYTPAYTVRVSMPHPIANSDGVKLSAICHIVVLPKPAGAKLTAPDSIYLTDDAGSVSFGWAIENYTAGESAATLSITHITGDSASASPETQALSGSSGTYTLPISKVASGSLKETYQISLSVANAEGAASVDAFPLYVYAAGAMQLEVNGQKTENVTLDNTPTVSGTLPTDTLDILAMREELGLIEYIGINYDDFSWSSFSDGIRWATSDDDKVSVNYRQGGLYENIRNFSYSTYLPETKMALSSVADGTATITATHANTGMSDSVTVSVKTLKNVFYLFQLTPAVTTTLTYNDGKGAKKTVSTNADGVLALYEPDGIAGDVYLRAEANGDLYLGTIYSENIQSGERDATKLQLYPLNTFTLRPAAKVELYLTQPDGTPYTGSVSLRGGVYKNGVYCAQAQFGPSTGSLTDGDTDQTLTVDQDGKLTVCMDYTQFWTASSTEVLKAEDKLGYVFELSDIGSDSYYPLFVSVDGNLYPDDVVRNGSAVVPLEAVPAGGADKPFVARQVISYGTSERNVRGIAGKIGPNSSFKNTALITTMYLWGVQDAQARDYSLSMVDDKGYVPGAQTSETGTYPFSSIPIVTNTLTLTKATMTASGWLPAETEAGLRTRLSKGSAMLQEQTMPFRVVDLTDVPPVDTAASSVLVEMQSSFGFTGTNISFGDENNILTKAISGQFTDLLTDLQTNASSPVFKIIISPSDDNSVFNALIWGGYNTLDMKDMDYGKDGVAVNADFMKSEFEAGVPGVSDLSDMSAGTYDPEKTYNDNADAGKQSDLDIGVQLEGYYEGQFYYSSVNKKWEFRTLGGGFSAGVGIGFSTSINAMAGPVPLTATFGAGGSIQLEFKAATVYKSDGGTANWSASALEKDSVTDCLTSLRVNGYVEAFGGIGFDYSVIALKVGLFGGLTLDSTNKFLSRPYLSDDASAGKDAAKQLNGQGLGVSGEVGIKFVAQFLFISYEYVLASGGFAVTKTFNDWSYIDGYWDGKPAGLAGYSVRALTEESGMSVASASATLQNREYLEEYARSWGSGSRVRLMSLSAANTVTLQTNANPMSYPAVSDDGALMAYVSDADSASIYDSRVFVGARSGSAYSSGSQIADPTGFAGYGDSSVSLSGDSSFAAAAFVRMSASIPEKNAGDAVTAEEQNLLMNSTEVVASIYNGTSWTSARITDNGTPDLAPVAASNGNGKAIVFWRSVYSSDARKLLGFDAEDAILYSVYENGVWSEARMAYNGASGSVKGMRAAMLPDGTALAAYTLDRNPSDGLSSDYEIAYSVVNGSSVNTMIATRDSYTDENPQVAAASFGSGDDRFILGWYSGSNGGDIRLAAVDASGNMSNSFPESLSAVTSAGSADIGSSFTFAKLSGKTVSDLTILWTETENANGIADHSVIKGVKLCRDAGAFYFSGAQELIELPARTLANSFDSFAGAAGTVGSVIQGTWYDPVNTESIGGVSVAMERTDLLTASSGFAAYSAAVDTISVDYRNLSLNAFTPVQFTVRNDGTSILRNLSVKVGAYTAGYNGSLMPNESAVITVSFKVGDTVINPAYTVSEGTSELASGTVYMDYNDIGISGMEVISEHEGKRDVRLTLYNSSAARLAGSGRTVELGLYTDNTCLSIASVGCTSDGVAVNSDKTLTISGDALTRMDNGALTITVTFDLADYVKNIIKAREVPESGVYLYASACVKGTLGGSVITMPEMVSSDNQGAVLLTGALARTGELSTLDVAQDNSGTSTVATVTLKNNSLRSQSDKGALLATLLDAGGNVLESRVAMMSSALTCEQSLTRSISFTRSGARVVLCYAVPTDTLTGLAELKFSGLEASLSDFTDNGEGQLVYSLSNVSAGSTVVSFIANDMTAVVTVNGTSFTGSGSLNVVIPYGSSTIEIKVGDVSYVLSLSRSGGGGASEPQPVNPFADVSPADYFYDAVLWAVKNGVTEGTSKTAFSPHSNCTRAQVITFLWRAAGCPAPKTSAMPFTDVARGEYYYDAVLWAVESKITSGTTDTTFSPDATVTRGQTVTFIWRWQGSPKPTGSSSFSDVAQGTYYESAVLWAVQNGITKGTSDNTFSPDDSCTRAHVVTFLYRCLNK